MKKAKPKPKTKKQKFDVFCYYENGIIESIDELALRLAKNRKCDFIGGGTELWGEYLRDLQFEAPSETVALELASDLKGTGQFKKVEYHPARR